MPEERKTKIGFVILTWNSEKVIGKCLESVFSLEQAESYAVVVDNGSTDGTRSLLDNFAREYPQRFSLICYPENRGTTVTRNEGIRRASAWSPDYYCILDSDTRVNDAAFYTMIEEMEIHPEYGLIGPSMVNSQGVPQVSARCFPTLHEKLMKVAPVAALQKLGEKIELQQPPTPGASSYPVDYLLSACWLLRPEVFEKVGLLDEKIFYAPEDAEYCIRVWKARYQVAWCPRAEIVHEWQRLSRKMLISKLNWEHIKGLAYMFRKHRYLFRPDNIKKPSVTRLRGE